MNADYMGWYWMVDSNLWIQVARIAKWRLAYAVYAARERWFDLRIAWIDWRLSLLGEEVKKDGQP